MDIINLKIIAKWLEVYKSREAFFLITTFNVVFNK